MAQSSKIGKFLFIIYKWNTYGNKKRMQKKSDAAYKKETWISRSI